MGQEALAYYLCFSGSVSCGEGSRVLEQHCWGSYTSAASCCCVLCVWSSASLGLAFHICKKERVPLLGGDTEDLRW